MKHYLIFAGTTEGRELTNFFLQEPDIFLTVCVATEYGTIFLPKHPRVTVHSGRMTEPEIQQYLTQHTFTAVFDATHPYAVIVSQNIFAAAQAVQLPYYRILRPADNTDGFDHVIYTHSMEEVITRLSSSTGNILVTTGSKELACFTRLSDYQNRVYARILSQPKMLQKAIDSGFSGKNLLCMQGPFSEEMNLACIHHVNARFVVTKNSGKIGGFMEKVTSTKKAGIPLLVIGRPPEPVNGIFLEDILNGSLTSF